MPTSPHESGGLWSPGRRSLTTGLVLSVTLVASEALAIANVMPIVAADLDAGSRDLYGWVFSGFLLSSLVGIVLAGLLIDRGSLVRPFALGLGLFSVGLLAGGLAPSMPILVGARVLQGIGAGAIPAVAYVAIGRALPENLRPRMFATLSTAWVVPGLVGPGIAGAVAEWFHWRLVFLGLLPLIVIAGAMTLPALAAVASKASAADGEHDVAMNARRRLPLALILAIGAGMTVAGLTDANLLPGLPLVGIGIAIALPAFHQLTPPGTLRAARGLPAAVLLRGILTFAFFSADVYVPVALEDWRGTSATEAGLALTAATLTWTAGAWIQAHWIERTGTRLLVRSGFVFLGLGILGFTAILSPAVPILFGVVAWGVAGLGMGLSYSPLSLTVLREADPDRQGEATAGLQLSDVLGSALGAGVAGAILAFGGREGSGEWIGLAGAFGLGLAGAIIGLSLTGRLPGRRLLVSAAAAAPRSAVEEPPQEVGVGGR